MAQHTYAWRSSTGKYFATQSEAERDEINAAADVLAGVEKAHLVNVATGMSMCASTRDAICRLAEAIKRIPATAEAA